MDNILIFLLLVTTSLLFTYYILKNKIFKSILFPSLKISSNVMKRVVNDLYEYVRNNKKDTLDSNENLLFIYGNISFDIYFDIIFKHNEDKYVINVNKIVIAIAGDDFNFKHENYFQYLAFKNMLQSKFQQP